MTLSYDEIKAKHYGRNGDGGKPYRGANVRMFMDEVPVKNAPIGSPPSRIVPSIGIQYPGMDESVRKIEPQDIAAYPELYAALQAAEGVTGEVQEVSDGHSIREWTIMPRSVVHEFWHKGFRTVEQVAAANDAAKRALGPLSSWVKKAQLTVEGYSADGTKLAALKEQVEKLTRDKLKLAEMLEAANQRIDAIEGTDLSEQNSQASAPRKRTRKTVEVD